MRPSANPIDLICQMRKRKRGEISYGELGRRMKMRVADRLDFIHWLDNEAQLTAVLKMAFGVRTVFHGLIQQETQTTSDPFRIVPYAATR